MLHRLTPVQERLLLYIVTLPGHNLKEIGTAFHISAWRVYRLMENPIKLRRIVGTRYSVSAVHSISTDAVYRVPTMWQILFR